MRYIYICALLLMICSCKEEKVEQVNQGVPTAAIEKVTRELEIVLELKTDKSDDIKLMMNNIEVDEFQRKNVHIIEKLQPSTSVETVNANFGANNISKNVLINLGNKEVKNITITNIKLFYGDKSILIVPADIEKYFSINKYVNLEGDVLKTLKVDGKHTPTLTLKRKIINDLVRE